LHFEGSLVKGYLDLDLPLNDWVTSTFGVDQVFGVQQDVEVMAGLQYLALLVDVTVRVRGPYYNTSEGDPDVLVCSQVLLQPCDGGEEEPGIHVAGPLVMGVGLVLEGERVHGYLLLHGGQHLLDIGRVSCWEPWRFLGSSCPPHHPVFYQGLDVEVPGHRLINMGPYLVGVMELDDGLIVQGHALHGLVGPGGVVGAGQRS
jgi:hypothetical protein